VNTLVLEYSRSSLYGDQSGPLNRGRFFKNLLGGDMRKYQYQKHSLFLATNLGKINWGQKKWEDYVKNDFCPLMKLRQKLFFYYQMLKMKKTLKLMKRGDHISLSDYFKLRDMWLQIALRIYQPR